MASETAASDHASTTDEQYVKKEKDEGIAQMIASLANEDEVKHDKPEDTPSSKTKENEKAKDTPSSRTEEDEVKAKLAAIEVEKPDDSLALEASADDSQKHDKVENAQSPTPPPTEGDDQNVKPDVSVEKIGDSVASDASVADEDNAKAEKELALESHTVSDTEPVHDAANSQPDEAPTTEPTVEETPPQQLESEPLKTDEKKQVQPKTENILEASAETIEKPSNTAEANPVTESEEVAKEAQVLETVSQVEEKPETEAAQVHEKIEEPEKESEEVEQPITVEVPEPVATQVQEKTEEPEKESQEAEQQSTVEVHEPVATQVQEKSEERDKELQEAEQPITVEVPDPVATQVLEKTEKLEKELLEAEQPSTVTVPEPSVEEKPSDTTEEKATGPSENVVEETKNYETGLTETVTAGPVVTEVEESQKEQEKQSLEQREEEENPETSVIPEQSAESSDAIKEKTRELEFEQEVLKEINNIETEKVEPVAAKVDENQSETEKAEPVAVKVDENQSEKEKQEEKEQIKTVIPETEAESADQQANVVEAHPPKDSGIEEVKGTSNPESETVPEKLERTEPLSTKVEKKPGEQLHAEASNDVETKQEIVLETTKSEETSDDTIKEEKTDKEEETSLTKNAAQVSSNGEPQENLVESSRKVVVDTSKSEIIKEEKTDKEEESSLAVNAAQVSTSEEPQANIVEPSPQVAEKVVEEVDDQKESSITVVVEAVSNEAAGIIKSPEQASIGHESKTDLKERECVVPAAVEEKVVAIINDDDKREPEAPNAVPESSQQEQVESKKVEEQNEASIATTEAADRAIVDDKKEANTDTKVEEISRAISEPVRETLASKFEEESVESGVKKVEKTEVQATEDSELTKASKDLPKENPTKPAPKQSNNIISKVKQSLVKAKKAITGKSPSSKNLSSGDIKVK